MRSRHWGRFENLRERLELAWSGLWRDYTDIEAAYESDRRSPWLLVTATASLQPLLVELDRLLGPDEPADSIWEFDGHVGERQYYERLVDWFPIWTGHHQLAGWDGFLWSIEHLKDLHSREWGNELAELMPPEIAQEVEEQLDGQAAQAGVRRSTPVENWHLFHIDNDGFYIGPAGSDHPSARQAGVDQAPRSESSTWTSATSVKMESPRHMSLWSAILTLVGNGGASPSLGQELRQRFEQWMRQRPDREGSYAHLRRLQGNVRRATGEGRKRHVKALADAQQALLAALGMGCPVVPKTPRTSPLTDIAPNELVALADETVNLVRTIISKLGLIEQGGDRKLWLTRLWFPCLARRECQRVLGRESRSERNPETAATELILLRLGYDVNRNTRDRFNKAVRNARRSVAAD